MADTVEKNAKTSGEKKPKEKKPNIFSRIGSRIARFFREYRSEVKKVIWPTFPVVVRNTVVVLVLMAFVGVLIGLVDIGLSELLKLVTVK